MPSHPRRYGSNVVLGSFRLFQIFYIIQVLDVIQKTFDGIVEALRNGQSLEFRRFGVFDVKVRKARIGRNPHKPEQDITIPEHRVVRFRPGKEMKAIFGQKKA